MRILVGSVHYAPQRFGGATLVAEQMVQALVDRGHEVVVFATTRDPGRPIGQLHRHSASGVPVITINISPIDSTGSFTNPDGVVRYEQILNAVRPDVMHLHTAQGFGIDLLEVAQQSTATVVTLHDAWWFCERQFMVRKDGTGCAQSGIRAEVCATCVPRPNEHEERQRRSAAVLAQCDRVLAPSRSWATIMTASGIPRDVMRVNENGVQHPSSHFTRTPRPGPLRIGYVGGLHAVKGYQPLLEALTTMRRSDYELVIADAATTLHGRPSMSHRDWPIPGLARIVPGYTPESMDSFYGDLDLLLFPSRWAESFGLTVREAMLRGVWPVASDGGGAAEVIDDGVNGTLIPMNWQPDQLATALTSLLDSPPPLPVPRPGSILTVEQQADDLERHLTEAFDHFRTRH